MYRATKKLKVIVLMLTVFIVPHYLPLSFTSTLFAQQAPQQTSSAASDPQAQQTLPTPRIPAAEGEEKTGVVLMPFKNLTGDPTLDVLAGTIKDTLDLNLRLLGRFSSVIYDDSLTADALVETSAETRNQTQDQPGGHKEPESAQGPEEVLTLLKSDNAVYITLERDEDKEGGPGRGFIISASVYTGAEMAYTVETKERADDLFAVFDAADRLTDSLLSGLVGKKMEYGALRVVNRGAPGKYRVGLGDTDIGKGPVSIEALVAGNYILYVTQERLLGTNVIYQEEITVEPNGEAVVSIEIPILTSEEERYLAVKDSDLRRLMRNGLYEAAEIELSDLITELSYHAEKSGVAGTSDAQTPIGYRAALERYTMWQSLLREEASFFGGDTRPESLGGPDLNVRDLGARFFIRNTPLPGIRMLDSLITERYRHIPFRTVSIDGDFSDWEGVTPLFTHLSPGRYYQRRGEKPATEIEAVYLTQDQDNIYFRFVLSDGDISRTTHPTYKVFIDYRPNLEHFGFQVEWAPWNNRWEAVVFHWREEERQFNILANGSFSISGNSLEARFPQKPLERFREPGTQYNLIAVTHTRGAGEADGSDHPIHHLLNTRVLF